MAQAVLYIGHGSRVAESVHQVEAFIRKSKVKINVPIQEYSFLELAKPTIEESVIRCIARGATNIVAIPLLLLSAGHAKHDIPLKLQRLREKFPNVAIHYGEPFGVDHEIVDLIVERMLEKRTTFAKDARILLIGRGSSDPDTVKDIENIAELLRKKSGVSHVNLCYLAACEPDFISGLHAEVRQGASQIFVVPYLLFTGFLMQTIERKIKELKTPTQSFLLCPPLGSDEKLVNILARRVAEMINHASLKHKVESMCTVIQ